MKELALVLALFAVALTGQAQTPYNLRATYNAAHPDNYVIDFNGHTSGLSIPSATEATPVGSVVFDAVPAVNNIEFVDQNSFGFLGPNNLVLYAFNGQYLMDSLSITLPANTFTFGLDLISPHITVAEEYKISIFSGATPLGTLISPSVNNAYTFVGFDSLMPITSIFIQITEPVGSPVPVIDNFTVAVPEPGPNALMALGAIGLLALARRKKK